MADLSFGVRLKREGKLEDALYFYDQVEVQEPENRNLFAARAKVLYLLDREEEAVDNYLIYLALSLRNTEEEKAEPVDPGGPDSLLQIYYPEDFALLVRRCQEVHPSAPYLLREPGILNHLGHALLDHSSDLPDALKQGLESYRKSLLGDEGEPSEDAPAYTQAGLDFALDNFTVLLAYIA